MNAIVPGTATPASALVDRFGRRVDYVRLSVTDRCDFRCVYCMAEEMQFLPRREILSLEELLAAAEAFVALGVGKIRRARINTRGTLRYWRTTPGTASSACSAAMCTHTPTGSRTTTAAMRTSCRRDSSSRSSKVDRLSPVRRERRNGSVERASARRAN